MDSAPSDIVTSLVDVSTWPLDEALLADEPALVQSVARILRAAVQPTESLAGFNSSI